MRFEMRQTNQRKVVKGGRNEAQDGAGWGQGEVANLGPSPRSIGCSDPIYNPVHQRSSVNTHPPTLTKECTLVRLELWPTLGDESRRREYQGPPEEPARLY